VADLADGGSLRRNWTHLLAAIGLAALAAAVAIRPGAASSAADQDWSPFVLVAGLLLIGLVAEGDGVFAAAGQRLARAASSGVGLLAGAAGLIGVVTALLNLDTSVAFLTPVMVYAARSRGGAEAPLLYACLLLSNAGSLFLPGSNLTNLIVLGQLHLTGGQFLARMWGPALSALVVAAAIVAVCEHRSLRAPVHSLAPLDRLRLGLGLPATIAAAVLVLVLQNPAIPVAAVGVVVTGTQIARGRVGLRRAFEIMGLPVLVGLFGVAAALGTLGRVWSGPANLLTHLDRWGTAAFAAVASVVVNNLPAASLLASRPPHHPFALLIGLNLGPNLFVTGSLAWVLWWRAARLVGAHPSIQKASLLGAFIVPASMAAALGVLAISNLQ
jgi:arsenical pump membrane protein